MAKSPKSPLFDALVPKKGLMDPDEMGSGMKMPSTPAEDKERAKDEAAESSKEKKNEKKRGID